MDLIAYHKTMYKTLHSGFQIIEAINSYLYQGKRECACVILEYAVLKPELRKCISELW